MNASLLKIRLRDARYVLAENPLNILALVLLLVILGAALFGSVLAPHDPLATNSAQALQPPSALHWFGTDQLGRDIFSRVLVATRLDLTIAFGAVILSCVVGSLIGAMIGYWGGPGDVVVSRLVDVLMAFPLFVLAMGLVAALGNSVINIIYATAIINLPFYIRLCRTEVRVRRNLGYIEAAKVGGSSDIRIMTRFLLPNIGAPIVIQASVNLGWAVLNAAGLSFLGLGVSPPTPEWGILVAEGARFMMSGEWWVALFPGLALMLTVFTFNLTGDALRDLLDPRMRT
ncbi:ABC transporter permease [Pseudomonas sp. GX19020]|uniref:ABC transporter permease n=1 Tax=Pseudomonadota TaxID=1224 RepID=UPI00089D5142|nr:MULTISPECIES: ABC transporter permease [Pseudomonadota]MCL4067527.1 ABC transporter permease [Pseudomonas sp. GX19020]SED87080.1 peptide/nickel transport system permease protein [Rhodobacter sp. 24-YEA-8]